MCCEEFEQSVSKGLMNILVYTIISTDQRVHWEAEQNK